MRHLPVANSRKMTNMLFLAHMQAKCMSTMYEPELSMPTIIAIILPLQQFDQQRSVLIVEVLIILYEKLHYTLEWTLADLVCLCQTILRTLASRE